MKRRYKTIPTKLSEKEFNEFIFPYLSKGSRGPDTKISYFKMFNYILYLLHTGCQWYQLPIEKDQNGNPEISYSRLFKHFRRWVVDGCFNLIFEGSIARLLKNGLIDLSVIHGDGTNTAAKKGAMKLASMDTRR